MDVESTVIDNTELALDVPEKKLVKQIVEIQSDDTCDACTDLEGLLKDDLIPKAEVPTEIAKSEATEDQKKEGVPQSKVCRIYDDGSKECGENILGGDREEWVKELKVKEEKKEEVKQEKPEQQT